MRIDRVTTDRTGAHDPAMTNYIGEVNVPAIARRVEP